MRKYGTIKKQLFGNTIILMAICQACLGEGNQDVQWFAFWASIIGFIISTVGFFQKEKE